jgi:Raf kinase inhibitor-like YbhB/YbcL family protein
MKMKRFSQGLLGSAALVVALSASAASEPILTLTSSAFKDGQLMPKKVSAKDPQNANCVGENVSPPLAWKNVPEGTKSFALLMEDPEGRGGAGVHHMVIYGIPPSVTGFAEGELSKASDKFVGGKSTQGVGTFTGPCTRPGPPHHYTFVLIATDFDPKELPPGLTRDEFLAKLAPASGPSHSKSAAGLIGQFKNPR